MYVSISVDLGESYYVYSNCLVLNEGYYLVLGQSVLASLFSMS